MIKNPVVISVVSFILLITALNAFAYNVIPSDSQPLSIVLQQLHRKGITDFDNIEFKEGAYEAVIIGTYGSRQTITIDPKSGVIRSKPNLSDHLTMLDAAKKIEAAGYSHISKIESCGNVYKVNASGRNGKEVELTLDRISGEIEKQ